VISTFDSLKRPASVGVVAVSLALLAGCGGSSTKSATSPATAATSPTAELATYRAALKPKNEAVESARRSFEKVRYTGSNYSELASAFTTYTSAYEAYLTGLEQTQAPISVANVAQSYIAHLRQHLGDLQEALKAAQGHDGAALSADLQKARASAKECTVAASLYAEACRW